VKYRTLRWQPATAEARGALVILDQTRLPGEVVDLVCTDVEMVAEAIEMLRVRGAPAIGVAAAYGVALGAQCALEKPAAEFQRTLEATVERLARTRPTAVNLFWALRRMQGVMTNKVAAARESMCDHLLAEANRICLEDQDLCRRIGQHGAALLKDGDKILTHCNAGSLATAGSGTALGVVYAAHEDGKKLSVFADETRPLLQGSRLTAWELMQNGVDVTVICDGSAATVMRGESIDCVIVGSDRIAANGDVANKIGTYGVAILAQRHGIPFYVAAPTSTIDIEIPYGDQIPIEERRPEEITAGMGKVTAPAAAKVFNPAFDVTPHDLVSAIITEFGVAREPYEATLREWVQEAAKEVGT
jgi:methylthioribose-1-phosphate isomerase